MVGAGVIAKRPRLIGLKIRNDHLLICKFIIIIFKIVYGYLVVS